MNTTGLERLDCRRAALQMLGHGFDWKLLLEPHANHGLLIRRKAFDQGIDRVAQHMQFGLVFDAAWAGQALIELNQVTRSASGSVPGGA